MSLSQILSTFVSEAVEKSVREIAPERELVAVGLLGPWDNMIQNL